MGNCSNCNCFSVASCEGATTHYALNVQDLDGATALRNYAATIEETDPDCYKALVGVLEEHWNFHQTPTGHWAIVGGPR